MEDDGLLKHFRQKNNIDPVPIPMASVPISSTFEFQGLEVSAHWLHVDLIFKQCDEDESTPVRLSISNSNARQLTNALTVYLGEVRSWRIRDLVNGINVATDDQIDQMSEILGLNKDG